VLATTLKTVAAIAALKIVRRFIVSSLIRQSWLTADYCLYFSPTMSPDWEYR
jgi:hypothetical protein